MLLFSLMHVLFISRLSIGQNRSDILIQRTAVGHVNRINKSNTYAIHFIRYLAIFASVAPLFLPTCPCLRVKKMTYLCLCSTEKNNACQLTSSKIHSYMQVGSSGYFRVHGILRIWLVWCILLTYNCTKQYNYSCRQRVMGLFWYCPCFNAVF